LYTDFSRTGMVAFMHIRLIVTTWKCWVSASVCVFKRLLFKAERLFYFYFYLFLILTDKQCLLNQWTQQNCYDLSKNCVPRLDSNPGLQFLRQMRCPLRHAAMAHCYNNVELVRLCSLWAESKLSHNVQ
jgi:hypothetical protein